MQEATCEAKCRKWVFQILPGNPELKLYLYLLEVVNGLGGGFKSFSFYTAHDPIRLKHIFFQLAAGKIHQLETKASLQLSNYTPEV